MFLSIILDFCLSVVSARDILSWVLERVDMRTITYTFVYGVSLYIAAVFDVVSTFVIISIMSLILRNLGTGTRKNGELSAYSVFNEGK